MSAAVMVAMRDIEEKLLLRLERSGVDYAVKKQNGRIRWNRTSIAGVSSPCIDQLYQNPMNGGERRSRDAHPCRCHSLSKGRQILSGSLSMKWRMKEESHPWPVRASPGFEPGTVLLTITCIHEMVGGDGVEPRAARQP
jgi:hypothetical protein